MSFNSSSTSVLLKPGKFDMSNYPLNLESVESVEVIRPQEKKRYIEILEKIEEISGENVFKCMQCGCCSATCPVSDEMEFAPAQINRLLQLGAFEELKKSQAIWFCASCYSCLAKCPKGIDIAKITEAVRQIFLRKREGHQDLLDIPEEKLRRLPQIALISFLKKFPC